MMPGPEGNIGKYGTVFDLKFLGLVGDTNVEH